MSRLARVLASRLIDRDFNSVVVVGDSTAACKTSSYCNQFHGDSAVQWRGISRMSYDRRLRTTCAVRESMDETYFEKF